MHNNFYFLKQLARELNSQLKDFTLVSTFTQSKDELVTEFNNGQRSFFIKASLLPSFCCLSFPSTFSRARKNSIDLFLPLLMKKVLSVRVFNNERAFAIELEDGNSLIYKMHGNRANVLRVEHDAVKEIFRNHLKADFDLTPASLHKTIDWSRETFEVQRLNISRYYFTFGKRVKDYLDHLSFANLTSDRQWSEFQILLTKLDTPTYYLTQVDSDFFLSLLQMGEVKRQYVNPIDAINEFFNAFVQAEGLAREKGGHIQKLRAKIKASQSYIQKARQKLSDLQGDQHWQQWGDLVMAHLHLGKPGLEKLTVENFYDNNTLVEIPLKKELSLQKNAEVFYRKSKNQVIEIQKIQEGLTAKEKELKISEQALTTLDEVSSLKELRIKIHHPATEAEERKSHPFHEFEFKGFRIWVGKDAHSNDQLTLKFSFKEDLWLHAKDVAGSHVLIKYQAGKKFPKEVIERAAQLAAYNSKRKTESLCPVSVTPKKFVRKRKGDPPGAVVVEREEVILVEPKL